ncbi:HNH endonuclease [Bacteroides ihuae]|uniref:HNH endonuclease n=1 Tax=Bacteroides ihuae TaxID=1852362 RepID=UPI0008DAC9DB|nr:HNH endonuclease [Bacteroides ihuae]
MKPSYRFYATLLDAFNDYLNSDAIWNKYWGFSENPPHDPEEFHEQQFKELIDRINRKPFDSEAADRGTAFNEVIDCMIENRKSDTVIVERVYSSEVDFYQDDVNAPDIDSMPQYKSKEIKGKLLGLNATLKNRTFFFPIALCREFADYFKGALTQQRVEAVLPTCFGDVLVYGLIDELMPTSVHDIKTTGRYSAFKFKNHFQHLVYPYALMQNGSDVRLFEYNITDFKETYTESYTFVPERDIPILTTHCEEFIRFLEDNRELITDRKIFGLE